MKGHSQRHLKGEHRSIVSVVKDSRKLPVWMIPVAPQSPKPLGLPGYELSF